MTRMQDNLSSKGDLMKTIVCHMVASWIENISRKISS